MNNTNNFYLIQQTQQQQHLQQQQQQQQQLQQPHHQQNHTTINDLNELVYYWKNFRVQDLKVKKKIKILFFKFKLLTSLLKCPKT